MINQKEYLKKYMSSGDSDDKKKKKKKKFKTGAKTVKIIDDDLDLKNMRPIRDQELDILLEGEDAPQIAGIVDDSGPVDFTDKRRWKIISEDGDLTVVNRAVDKKEKNQNNGVSAKQNKSEDRSRHSKSRHASPSERSKDDDSDLSPPRLKHSKNKHSKHRDSSLRKRAHDDDSDLSPPRKSKNNYDSDLSPPRQSRNNDSDLSPRRSTKHRKATHTTSGQSYGSSDNKDSDSDLSPPRRGKQSLDANLNDGRKKKDRDSDLSRSRRKEHRSRKENSPRSNLHRDDRGYDYPRNSSKYDTSRSNRNKRERQYKDRDRKSRSHTDTKDRRKKSRWDDEMDDPERGHAENHSKERNHRMTKTLDGKTAGLQDARALREETDAHKQREVEQFNKLSKTVSGEGQAPILRDKMGRKRNLEAEAAEKYEREKHQREMNEQYNKWGKGLKQIKDREERLQNDLYEMNKPLARYADDEDLDKQLREELKEGDPMLEYIKQKQIKEGKRKPDPPQYQGSYVPNRFSIKPGHRWDGVDRSNGYEKKWFETQNAKKALQEEAYKWSTADM